MNHEKIRINDNAFIETYLLRNSEEYNVGKKRSLVIICPGGGYAFTSDREAEVIALKFNSVGINAVVLWYTTGDKVKKIPENALFETAWTVNYVREKADEWLIDTDNIGICGFSAGGHLALQMATRWNETDLADRLQVNNEMLKVDFAILGYPMVFVKEIFPENDLGFANQLIENPLTSNQRYFGTDKPTDEDLEHFNLLNHVDEETCPMFIWHTTEDVLVDVEHSLKLGQKLRNYEIPFEMHIFEKGEHGLALGDRTTARKKSHFNDHVKKWFDLCEGWLSPYIDNEY